MEPQCYRAWTLEVELLGDQDGDKIHTMKMPHPQLLLGFQMQGTFVSILQLFGNEYDALFHFMVDVISWSLLIANIICLNLKVDVVND